MSSYRLCGRLYKEQSSSIDCLPYSRHCYCIVTNEAVSSAGLSPELNNSLCSTYRVIQEESARLQEMIVCVILSKEVHMNMGLILNSYGVMTA